MIDFILSLTAKDKPEMIVLSSVRYFSDQNVKRLEKECERLVILDSRFLKEKYDIPEYLSPDRAASVVASRYLFKGKSCSVFDFGTIFAVDFMDKDGNYEGGCVSPGCHTRFRSLYRYSKSLPLLDAPEIVPELGTDVVSSINSGVISGMMFEIDGYVLRKPENICVFTGGDAIYFAKRRKNSIFVVCNLVLMGLALIALQYDQND